MNNRAQTINYGFNFQNSYARLDKRLFTSLNPVSVKDPSVILWNESLAKELGLTFSEGSENELAEIFSGNRLPENSQPLAQAYAGHQFGHFTMLGDGRAILLGEQITPDNKRYDIQFKGSGQTPYSRGGDGRATLYSMLREYLISEAVHHLGVPTTRSLAVVSTGEDVFRESVHPGAILARVASSHIRVGTFEYVAHMQPELISDFTRYTIDRHFPEIAEAENPSIALFDKVMQLQMDLIINWMRIGFIHGVMNTDNMSIPGETIDYGPCAFINDYHPLKVFSSIDHYGRYAFGNQPTIAQWNLACFASALLSQFDENEETATEMAKEKLEGFEKQFSNKFVSMMCRKLGIEKPESVDTRLVEELLDLMQKNKADYTNTFLALENKDIPCFYNGLNIYEEENFSGWLNKWENRVTQNGFTMEKAKEIMQKNNPAFIPRNHFVEEALEAASAKNDFSHFHKLYKTLSAPYNRPGEVSSWQLPPPDGDAGYETFCGT